MNGEVMGVSAMKSILKTGRFAPLVFSIMGIVTLFVACAPATYADVEGTIRGTVVDPSGAAVAGAAVKIVNVATNLERDVTSTGDGSFIAPNLPAGYYAVTGSKAGFRTYKQTGIRLYSAATFVVSAPLAVGERSATVEVTAAKRPADTTAIRVAGALARAALY